MADESLQSRLGQLLHTIRNVQLEDDAWSSIPDGEKQSSLHPLTVFSVLGAHLRRNGQVKESDALLQTVSIATAPTNLGGMALSWTDEISADDVDELLLLTSAWLEALNSAERYDGAMTAPLSLRPAGRPPMNVTEKIFAMHDLSRTGYVKTGDTIRVSVDWVMASEASWHGMLQVYNKLGDPGVFRNDRFWLAGDHVVDPRVSDTPLVQSLVREMDFARKKFKMTQFQGSNYTIMHTEFYRERAQPGQLVIGSDSHTCSAGANGCLSIGLGATEVTMALVTGQIWFKVPEVVEIRLTGRPARGVGGKDVILHILQQLKRNTVAADRVVEYTGPGCRWLSSDSRFAVANMTTEFGGITGIFAPDAVTKRFVDARKTPHHRRGSRYFRPDRGCAYAESYEIDLSRAEPCVARYPSPDDVVPVGQVAGTALDGVFIGACTTAEEDLVVGALVLKAGLDKGLRPVARGERRVVPGSRPIAEHLRKTGLAEIYERAGFTIGIPGCSYCVGMGADMAAPGSVWLSSQNRNFENRMGRGALGSLASAATVAASSFDMKVTSPQELIDLIPDEHWDKVKGKGSLPTGALEEPSWVEPAGRDGLEAADEPAEESPAAANNTAADSTTTEKAPAQGVIKSKVYRLGDFVDTDALAPAQFLLTSKDNKELGSHCMERNEPGFRDAVKDGHEVIVGGKAFGCGSSRQEAVQALLGVGAKCVIAKSFAFIFARNMPSLGLLGFTIADERFYELAGTGAAIEIDLDQNVLRVGGEAFPFALSALEKRLTEIGGMTNAFSRFGKRIYDVLAGGAVAKAVPRPLAAEGAMSW
ncbi:3-isopropylmalate dehydratase large subunit 2 [Pyricularia oryzae 70-15]|uniref:3-isopropylmalate dehydratase large subunit 2 n=3 Tax=Pyricularia oryzae TaxID=318829 RepID=G4NIJ9_PYRO7|nr:3-isopropylmalate dehydratase large subunit 2 [Pyricularia oryzae 70-15]EHA48059.1 3-isopropylmalate dehydratase large subunit 2 [Pyricularia oryzae 70-15]ELQ42876.1 3-isopropylmalate dehydratase large subunit 2 [Pyricularia oryzae Y34]KAI7908828.1 3-isopropylmalate dehydratase large subunit 2 [Pyricularia oryzae]KAI7909144.1 3-isopropylmalate dehydratase large subunit 2 [Pyricularia oryzae]